jgi:hypothetical protein
MTAVMAEVLLGSHSVQYAPVTLHRAQSLLEKVIVAQLSRNFPAFYGTLKFISVLKITHFCTLS